MINKEGAFVVICTGSVFNDLDEAVKYAVEDILRCNFIFDGKNYTTCSGKIVNTKPCCYETSEGYIVTMFFEDKGYEHHLIRHIRSGEKFRNYRKVRHHLDIVYGG